MKALAMLLVAALALGGCTPSSLDDTLAKVGPSACSSLSVAYKTFVAAQVGSERDRQIVDAAYTGVDQLCQDPAHITGPQLALVLAQTSVVVRVALKYKKVQANG